MQQKLAQLLLLLQLTACSLKAFFMHSKQKKLRSSAQIFNLRWNDTQDWIYDCRFCDLKGCIKIKYSFAPTKTSSLANYHLAFSVSCLNANFKGWIISTSNVTGQLWSCTGVYICDKINGTYSRTKSWLFDNFCLRLGFYMWYIARLGFNLQLY